MAGEVDEFADVRQGLADPGCCRCVKPLGLFAGHFPAYLAKLKKSLGVKSNIKDKA